MTRRKSPAQLNVASAVCLGALVVLSAVSAAAGAQQRRVDHRDPSVAAQQWLSTSQDLSWEDEVVALRRHFHMYPETAFDEFRTAKFVAEYLRGINASVREQVGVTGVVGLIEGARPGPTIAFRADMDGLPLQEANEGLPYRSRIDGVMHACGHDGHVAMLLVAAKRLMARRERLSGNVKLLFQPAEENIGGAMPMILDGALLNPNVSQVFGIHLLAGGERGNFALRDGPLMANTDRFSIRLTSPGGHGGMAAGTPDVVLAGAHLVSQIHTIVARDVVATEPAVISVGEFHAGTAPNILSKEANLTGTVRTFNNDVRKTIQQRLRVVTEGVAKSFRVGFEVKWLDGYPMVVNDPASADIVRVAARKVVGADHVVETPPVAGGEDFSYFLHHRPGAFVFLTASMPNAPREHHQPTFDFDEKTMTKGVELWLQLADDLLVDGSA